MISGLVTYPCDVCTNGVLTYCRGITANGLFIPSREIDQSIIDAILDRPDGLSWADGTEPVIEDAPCWKCNGSRTYDVEYVPCKIF